MKYSVIIPVFNAEKTLRRCVQSIVDQEYRDAEIILVNDGSTDQSAYLCRTYADRYENIVYIDKENGGVSSARNIGLNAAKGEYILFVDSDDYVSEQYFAALDLVSSDWDYLLFSYYVTDGKKSTEKVLQTFASEDLHSYFAKLGELLYRKGMNCPWNKRYKRSVIQEKNIRFHECLSIGEDALFNLQYALCCRSCKMIEHTLYYVSVENEDSLSRKPRSDLKEQLILGEKEMLNAIHAADMDGSNRQILLSAMSFLRLSEVYSEAKRMHIAGAALGWRWKEIGRLCKDINQQHMTFPNSAYCKLLSMLVKFRLTVLIDLIAWKLAR